MENLQAKRVVVLGFRCDVIGYDLALRGLPRGKTACRYSWKQR